MASKKQKMMGTAAGATQRSFVFRASYNSDGVVYVDAARFLSSFNQRLYRQGMNYCLKVDSSIMVAAGGATPGSGQYVEVQALPNNWQVRKAWAKGYRMFKQQINEIAKRSGASMKSVQARWHDFKIGYEHGTSWPYAGHPEYNGGNVEPTGAPFTYGDGEWDKSYITDLETDTRNTADMFGIAQDGATNEYGLLAMYDALPGTIGPDPQITATPDPYQEWVTDDEPSGLVIQDLATLGNEPPYNPDLLQVEAQKMFISANGQQPLSTGWFEAPCGLLKIISRSDSTFDSNWITLSVAPGDYKGVMAESMIAKVN